MCVCEAPVHVAVGGEGLSTDAALVRPLPAVDQHVSVERRGRAQALPADAAGMIRGTGVGVVLRGRERRCRRGNDSSDVLVMTEGRTYLSDVHGQLVLSLTVLVAERTNKS